MSERFLACAHTRGFTLLEVLVVLVIASLVSVVLMQGLSLVLNLRDSFSDRLLDRDRAALERARVVLPLQGLTPDFADGTGKFLGTAEVVQGLTTQPLLRRAGRPIPFSLTLRYDDSKRANQLIYIEDEDEPIVLSAWVGGRSSFRYIGDTAGWSDVWPPPESAQPLIGQTLILDVRPSQLPELILLDTQSPDQTPFTVAVPSRRNRIPRDPIF
jgi:general secretion pathway protein J